MKEAAGLREIDKLWKRFKGAQDTFFAARNAVNAERDKEFEANAEAKEALLAEYDERIRPDKDLDHARAELRKLQERWEEIGFVPRGRVREFEDKIGKLEKRVSEAADSQWRRTDPEAMARVQQFADRAAEFEAKAAEFEAAGKAKKAEDARAQAAQWREWADAAAALRRCSAGAAEPRRVPWSRRLPSHRRPRPVYVSSVHP